MTDIKDLLKERGGTHGHWPAQAGVSEAIWQLIQSSGKTYSASQAQALHMIATKLGRIITGDENEIDHWRDIAGYATLAANELEPKLAPGFTMQGGVKAAEAQVRAVQAHTLPWWRNHCPSCGTEEGYEHKKGCPLLPDENYRG